MRLARSVWVRLLRSRALRSLEPSVSFISTSASSAAVRPRKSAVEPTRQPARSRRLRLLRSMSAFSSCDDLVVLAQPSLTRCDDLIRGCLRRLAEYPDDHNRVLVDPIDRGGVLTSPLSQTSGLSFGDTSAIYVRTDMRASGA